MKSVAQVLKSKPEQTIEHVTPTTSVFDALKRMAEKNARSGDPVPIRGPTESRR